MQAGKRIYEMASKNISTSGRPDHMHRPDVAREDVGKDIQAQKDRAALKQQYEKRIEIQQSYILKKATPAPV
jgi:hypothetical protein